MIGIGGNLLPALRVAAAHADAWCTAGASPQRLRDLSTQLDEPVRQAGYNPNAIERTMRNGVPWGGTSLSLGIAPFDWLRSYPI